MRFEELRAGLRRGVEDAPLEPDMRVDLVLVLLKVASELQKIGKSLSEIRENSRPESMDGIEHFFSNLERSNGR